MRWKLRSAPERSTFTETPGYLPSNSLATFSPSARSTEVYQTTLPSFLAASIRSGVIFSAAGADWAELIQPLAASAVAEPASTRRRVSFLVIVRFLLSTFGRQTQPHLLARRDVLRRRCGHPKLRLVGERDRVVARRAEEHLAADDAAQPVPARRLGRRKLDLVLADRHRHGLALGERPPGRLERAAGDRDVRGIDRPALEDVAAADEAGDE